jgi:copper chaperone CopZ
LFVLTLLIAVTVSGGSTSTAVLHVEGMTCGACATSVKIVLKKVDGVVGATVSYEKKRAVVEYDPARVSPATLVAAIEAKLPYKARVVEDESR